MTLDYVRLPVSILRIEDLNFAQKIILGLVASLSKGLRLSNGDIGAILNISAGHVSFEINDMERKGYIRIENRQSRHRKIYLAKNPKVEAFLLHGKPESKTALLNGLTGTTSRKTRNITKGTEKKKYKRARDAQLGGDDDPKDNGQLFDAFWSKYPKRIAKQDALRAWDKLQPDQSLLSVILAAIERQKLWREDGKARNEFRPEWPHPGTWLRNQRWQDEIDAPEPWQPPTIDQYHRDVLEDLR